MTSVSYTHHSPEAWSEFKTGLRAGVSVAIGYIPIAITYGLLAKSTGLPLLATFLMSVIVFAGASQFIALNMITIGSGAIEIILTTFIVNIRQLLFSASINSIADRDSPWFKALYAFGITDETFTIAATSGRKIRAFYMFGLCLMAYSSWCLGSVFGYLVGEALPPVLQASMGIALYAMFIGLLVPSLKKSRKFVAIAGTSAIIHTILSYGLHMSTGWAIVIATLIAAIGIEFVWKERDDS